ncbi:MAG: sialidase family protein [Bryobacteraceae bacterium]
MHSRLLFAIALVAACAPAAELVSVRKIWDQAPHSAFGDIIRFRGEWFAVFREGKQHVATGKVLEDDGKLRVIASKNGDEWRSMALVEEAGVDLRDPHLSITADGRLMIVAGGSIYRNAEFGGRQPRVTLSKDGVHFTAPAKVLESSHWLWRVTWFRGKAWGVTKFGTAVERKDYPRQQALVTSDDGLHWKQVVELKVPGGDETTVRFLKDGTMVALMRREVDDRQAWIGHAKAPYTEWKWSPAGHRIGGPNFIVLPGGKMWAGGRYYTPEGNKTMVAPMTLAGYQPEIVLPSNGDSSYPGFVWHEGLLWTLYYSSHEGKASIYLAKIKP